MRFLHTSDWHVGKAVRGRSRADEHRAVLAELAEVADAEAVDLVVVSGDLFETAAPTAEAEQIVYRGLLDLTGDGARPVVVVSGNHDSARRLAAVTPLLGLAGVSVHTSLRSPDDGGVLALELGGVAVRIALVPFPSQRYVVGADALMTGDAATQGQTYDDHVRRIVGALATGFDADAVNLVAAHLFVAGGALGGGERSAHTIFSYAVSPLAFPATTHYVALGHLHRAQEIGGPCPIRYCGSPLQLDFGEEANRPVALVVDAEPATPAKVREVELDAGRPFVTLRGTLDELAVSAAERDLDEAWVRVVVREPARAGLDEEVRELLPGAVEVRVERPAADREPAEMVASRAGRSPHDLFAAYLADRDVDDPRVLALFDELHDEALASDAGESDGDAA